MALQGRNLLFQSNRSTLTCTYKCGNACLGDCTNTSSNPYFGQVVSRRTVLRGSALTALTISAGSALAACSTADEAGVATSTTPTPSAGSSASAAPKGMQFEPVAANTTDDVVVPNGYESEGLIAWGDPVYEDAPEFDPRNQTAAAAARQFGFNNDFAGLIEHPENPDRMVYMCSHEYTTEPQMFETYDPENPSNEQINIGLASHGHTILEVVKDPKTGKLTRAFGPLNRRITATTEFKLTGPLAGDDLVRTSEDPTGIRVKGTFANCAGGVTPWGTMLSGEENFEQYFANGENQGEGFDAEDFKRFGVPDGASARKWERLYDRFDVSKEPNEFHRFGYIVEIDPLDPSSTPVKHTALGRFKHEAGNIYVTDDGTVTCYSGDDARFEYIYKFVSSRKIKEGDIAHNLTILDNGTLYVAKLEGNSPESEITGDGKLPSDGAFDGVGTWMKLLTVEGDRAESHVDGFTAAEVAVYTRLAADKVGATKMDRPEDFEANPLTGKVYVALTNNSYRGATGENAAKSLEGPMEWAPVRENKNGLVMEIDDDHAGEFFTWNILLVCGDPDEANTYFGGFDPAKVSPISCPDNLAFDEHGNLWISTDGNALGTNDGLYAVGLEGENRGLVKCFLTVPTDAETCGPIVQKNRVLVNVQHPGENDEAGWENFTSSWPHDATGIPRPAVVVVWRPDGENIGIA